MAFQPLELALAPPKLTWMEEWWQYLFTLGNPLVVLTLLSFVHHEVIYFGRFIPYMLCDHIPVLRKYKIQDNRPNTNAAYWKCTKSLLFSHFVIQLPMMIGFHPIAEYFGMEVLQVPFPSWTKMTLQVALFMIFEDFYHYWMHRGLHHGMWYKKIHKVHHEWQAPFGLTAEYAHPLETLILGVGTIGGPIMYTMATGDLHMVTVLAWITIRLLQTIDAHSGYDFPWSLHNFLPFWGGSDHHDFHHYAFVGNYSSSFRWWDTWFGTDAGYERWKAKKEASKALEAKQGHNVAAVESVGWSSGVRVGADGKAD